MGEQILFHYNAQAFCSSIGADDHVVRRSDARLFEQGQWLNDTCIGLGLRWLAEERLGLRSDPGESDATHTAPNQLYFVDPPAASYLTIQCTDDDELLQANRELQLETRQLVLFPINDSVAFFQGSTHWSLLALRLGPAPAASAPPQPGEAAGAAGVPGAAVPPGRRVSFRAYDSSAHANAAAARAAAAKVLRLLQLLGVAAADAAAPVALEPSVQQTNGCDCGVHVLLEAERIAAAFHREAGGGGADPATDALRTDPLPSPAAKRRQLLALCERLGGVR